IDTLLEGFAQPANGPLLPHVWAYDSTLAVPKYNAEQAAHLLRQDGWRDSDGDGVVEKDGKTFVFSIKTNAGNQLRRDVAVMIQAQLRKVGVKAAIETVEWNQFIEQVFDRKDFDAVILAWDADFTVDPSPLWHSKAIENGYNFVSYHNPRVDSLLEAGRHTSDRHAAKAIWAEFQKIIVDDAPYTFLFIPDQLAGINKRVRDVKMDARGFLSSVSSWWIPRELRKTEVARSR
ncbi:MAG: peptide-binding protein, partial [Calditrichaeota bacterium]